MTGIPSYSDWYRAVYPFAQEHRALGSLKLFDAPARAPGHFAEPPVPHVSMQMSVRRRRGAARIRFPSDNLLVDLTAPTFIVAPAGQPGAYNIPTTIHLRVIEFGPGAFEGLARRSDDLGALHARAWSDPLPLLMAEHLWSVSALNNDPLEADYLAVGLTAVLSRLVDTPPLPAAKGGLAPWQERRATEYLFSHLDEGVTLQALAGVAELSTFHFARQFKQSTGLPPHQYLRRLRCDRAKELLANTNLPITDIAAQVGYETPQAFARMFRAEVGVSPSDYRRGREL